MAHDRTLDHFGVEDTTTAVLSAPIGRYPQYAVLQDVLVDLDSRLTFIEANPDSVVLSFTADAYILRINTLTANAYIHQGQVGSFTADASLHATVDSSFTANAYLIDATC
jgi:hypothetical protein